MSIHVKVWIMYIDNRRDNDVDEIWWKDRTRSGKRGGGRRRSTLDITDSNGMICAKRENLKKKTT